MLFIGLIILSVPKTTLKPLKNYGKSLCLQYVPTPESNLKATSKKVDKPAKLRLLQ